jgi:hypothetical protein
MPAAGAKGRKMKMAALVIAAGVLLSAAPLPRDRPLTGTWVADLDTQQGLPKDVYLVRDGTYSCESCVPRRHYPADGTLRTVAETPRLLEAVRIIDGRTISTRIIQPDLSRTTVMRVARDGRTATYVSTDRRAGIEGTLRTEYLARRTAFGPAGSHAVSGTWQGIRYVSVPLQLRTTILTDRGDELSYRTGTGYSYTARFGGAYEPVSGPYHGSITVAVQRVDRYRVVETRRRGSNVVQVRTYTVAADGRSMEIATTDPATNNTFRATSRRQQSR